MQQRNQVKLGETAGGFFGVTNVGWREILALLIGSIMLALISTALYDILTASWGDDRATLLKLLIGAALILALMVFIVFSALRFLTSRHISPPSPQDMPPHRALIAFVSLSSGTSHEIAAKHHLHPPQPDGARLERVVLFHSTAAESRERAWNFRTDHLLDHLAEESIKILILENLYSLRACYQAIEQAIDILLQSPATPPLTPADVVLEVTGGTAIFTAAATLAAVNRGVVLEYVEPKLNRTTGGPDYTNVKLKQVEIDWIPGWSPRPAAGSEQLAAAPVSSPPGAALDEPTTRTP